MLKSKNSANESDPLTNDSLENQLIRHALTMSYEAIPADVIERAKYILADSVAVGIAGSGFEMTTALKAAMGLGQNIQVTVGSQKLARVWGSGERVSPNIAAMINAYQIHNQEFDCLHEQAVVHPMAVILSSLLAYCEGRAIHGKDFLVALIVAVDAAITLGLAAKRPMRFFRPAVCGALGASLGLSRLARFTPEQTTNVLGIVYSQLSGTMQAHLEGSTVLPLQIAFNARATIDALHLVEQGFNGPKQALSGRFGYLELFEGEWDDTVLSQLGQALGQRWRISELSIKPFPTGRAAHAALDGIHQLRQQHNIDLEDIESITLYAPDLVRRLIDRPLRDDMTANYAKLCLPFLIAKFLLTDTIELSDFKSDQILNKAIQKLSLKVKVKANDDDDPNTLIPQSLVIEMRDGESFKINLAQVLGHPDRPLNQAERRKKLQDCVQSSQPAMSTCQLDRLITRIAKLESCEQMESVLDSMIASWRDVDKQEGTLCAIEENV